MTVKSLPLRCMTCAAGRARVSARVSGKWHALTKRRLRAAVVGSEPRWRAGAPHRARGPVVEGALHLHVVAAMRPCAPAQQRGEESARVSLRSARARRPHLSQRRKRESSSAARRVRVHASACARRRQCAQPARLAVVAPAAARGSGCDSAASHRGRDANPCARTLCAPRCRAASAPLRRHGIGTRSAGHAQTIGVGTSVGCAGHVSVGKSPLPPRLKSVGCGMGAMGTCGLQRRARDAASAQAGASAAAHAAAARPAGSKRATRPLLGVFRPPAVARSAPEGQRRARRDKRAVRRAAVIVAPRRLRAVPAADATHSGNGRQRRAPARSARRGGASQQGGRRRARVPHWRLQTAAAAQHSVGRGGSGGLVMAG
jgi:hypothetical protein